MTRRTVARGSLTMRQDITKSGLLSRMDFTKHEVGDLLEINGDEDPWTFAYLDDDGGASFYNLTYCGERDGVKVCEYRVWGSYEWFQVYMMFGGTTDPFYRFGSPTTCRVRVYLDRALLQFSPRFGNKYLLDEVLLFSLSNTGPGLMKFTEEYKYRGDDLVFYDSPAVDTVFNGDAGWWVFDVQMKSPTEFVLVAREGDVDGPVACRRTITLPSALHRGSYRPMYLLFHLADYLGSLDIEYVEVWSGYDD